MKKLILGLMLFGSLVFSQTNVVTMLPTVCPTIGILYELTDSGSANGLYNCPVQGAAPVAGNGSVGPQGPAGPAGAQGATGPNGANGNDGAAGPIGATGPQGAVGPTGPQGPTGANGNDGPQGVAGAIGPQGPAGNYGPLPPSVASSTWMNQASATTATINGFISMSDVVNEEGIHVLCQPAPATPYTISVQIRYLMQEISNKYPFISFGFSNGTKLELIDIYNNSGSGLNPGQYINLDQWNTTSSQGATLSSLSIFGPIKSLQVSDDGTNKTWYYSADDTSSPIFTLLGTEARTTFLTATNICWGIRTNAAAQKVSETLLAWTTH